MWKILSSKNIFKHPRLSLIEDEVELPNGVKTKYLKFESKGNAVTVICKRADGKILVQKEYSHPPVEWLYQFPGGHVPEDEDLKEGANRELMEEAKKKSNNLIELGNYLVNNRRSKSRMYIYLAMELEDKGLDGDLEEDIKSYWFTEEEIENMMISGEIINPHMLAGWNLYKLKSQKV